MVLCDVDFGGQDHVVLAASDDPLAAGTCQSPDHVAQPEPVGFTKRRQPWRKRMRALTMASVAGGARTRGPLCGGVGVEIAGERGEGRLRGRQGRQLFAYLAVNRSRAVSRDELVDAVWPYDPPPRPGAALSTQLSLLRSALGAERVEGRSEIQLILPPDAWVDVEAAVEAVGRAEAATARADW